MLSILYLVLESITVVLPILLAVAWMKKNFLTSRLRQSVFILLLFLIIKFNFYSILFGAEYIFNYMLNIATICANLIVLVWLNFCIYCKGIILYFFTSNWAPTFLLKAIPAKSNVKLSSKSEQIDSGIISSLPLNPWFVTGFTDGEGSFFFGVTESASKIIGWNVIIGFSLVAKNNPANLAMFIELQNFFGTGQVIFAKSNNYIRFTVNGLQNCLIIREHFIKYPLLSFKLVHFHLWSAVIDLLLAKEHLNLIGLLQIIALKAHSPLGLSEKLLLAFPDYTPVNCFDYNPDLALMNIHWIAGFINADGSFGLHMQNTVVRYRILITQHSRSLAVMQAIVDFLNLGKIYEGESSIVTIKINTIADVNTFISKFAEAQLLGAKALDYVDFCKAIDLINSKAHLTLLGKATYRSIAAGMNTTRTNFGSYSDASK